MAQLGNERLSFSEAAPTASWFGLTIAHFGKYAVRAVSADAAWSKLHYHGLEYPDESYTPDPELMFDIFLSAVPLGHEEAACFERTNFNGGVVLTHLFEIRPTSPIKEKPLMPAQKGYTIIEQPQMPLKTDRFSDD